MRNYSEFNKVFASRLTYYLDRFGMSQRELADRLGVGTTSVSNWCCGNTSPRMDKVDAMCRIFGCRRSDLMEMPASNVPEYDGIEPISTQRLPIMGAVACGDPVLMEEERDLYVDATTGVRADFVLRAKGDSMIGARIQDGDLVFVRAQESVENGQIAAVAIGDEATLKRVYFYPEQRLLILRAENPAFSELTYSGAELAQVRILGLAVAFQSDVK